jgi:hypothetical protein
MGQENAMKENTKRCTKYSPTVPKIYSEKTYRNSVIEKGEMTWKHTHFGLDS